VSKALDDADKCLALEPSFVKGYHRKASALHAMGEEAKSREAAELLLGVIGVWKERGGLERRGGGEERLGCRLGGAAGGGHRCSKRMW
jgi:hypothetical protein